MTKYISKNKRIKPIISCGFKISFCTTCKERLRHLKQTLPKNIKDNSNYPFIEFVILDYNSQDGLGDWMIKFMCNMG